MRAPGSISLIHQEEVPTVATLEQLQRFLNELALFKTTIKYGNQLTDEQVQMVKFKMYELIFDMEANSRASEGSDQGTSELTG
jgi:hypothetical protein